MSNSRRRAVRAGLGRASLLVALASVVFVPAATAADRVQVGRPGQNATPGFPLALHMVVTELPGYRAVGRFDSESRTWNGPLYRAASLEARRATVDWQATFDDATSAAALARGALGVSPWPTVERPRVQVPHVVGARRVGSIPAVALLTKAPGDNAAQYVSVVAFPLCRGVVAAVTFALLSPSSQYAGGPSEPFLVDGVPADKWNRDHALSALGQVTLDGHLPPGRVTARAAGRSVSGTVRDCRGDPMAAIQVRLLSGHATVARTRAAANGSYRLRAPGPGSYRVSVSLIVTGKGGSGTRSDSRTATVRVR